ncbi:hypothetical protein HY620_01530 [Candidatus Uhrbacteria bacterium]|nr:hypothetical protein [Candidatus Uhrbacteria bacterium]
MAETPMKCVKCRTEYVVMPQNAEFYSKMGVPTPRQCPICRFKQKAVWRNERTLYTRSCQLCGKNIISMYPQEALYTVYCHGCWYSDKWDAASYAMDYDPSRPFLEQIGELFTRVPRAATVTGGQNTNSDYQNWSGSNKDCYMVFNSGQNEMLMYSRGMRSCRDTIDCYYGVNVERSYSSVNVHDSSGVRWCQNVRSCLDSWFLRDCTGCTNCFGCVNLRYKEYHFFNEPLSKEEYERRVGEIVGSVERIQEMKKKFEEFSASHPFKATHNMKSEDCSGDYIVDSKNCHHSFEIDKNENANYNYFTKTAKDSYDCVGFGYDSELLYETVAVGFSHKVMTSLYVENGTDIAYCANTRASSSCIGCDGLNKSQYCILNKHYSESDYHALRETIITSMKQEGSWGSYFPLSLAPFAYNESIANDYYPMAKKEALAAGFRWNDALPDTRGKETMQLGAIPDHIKDVQESISKEILACAECGKNYKITSKELELYRSFSVPIPRECFNCRHRERLNMRGPMRLFGRQCSICSTTITTSISPTQPLTVLCDACYTTSVS